MLHGARVGRRTRAARPVVAAAVAGVLLAGAAPALAADGQTGAPAPLGYTTYGVASTDCTPKDPRIDSISGIAATKQGVYVQADKDNSLWQIDAACRPVRKVPLPGVAGLRDTEDLAATPDGTLWIGDVGGNRFSRTDVAIVRVPPTGRPVRYGFTYPDGPHDAETVLISPDHKQILVVTKVASGVSTIFAPAAAPKAGGTVPLAAVGTVRASTLADRNTSKPALLFTGGAVSPDGLHVVLRTYIEAWEWDAPDGDLATALTGLPRKIELPPKIPQGEAVGYSADGESLLVAGEQLQPLFRVAIVRPRYAPTGEVAADEAPPRSVDRGRVAAVLIAGAALCLVMLVGAVIVERRRSRRRVAPIRPPVVQRPDSSRHRAPR